MNGAQYEESMRGRSMDRVREKLEKLRQRVEAGRLTRCGEDRRCGRADHAGSSWVSLLPLAA